MERLAINEVEGIVYHRHGLEGDYDDASNLEELFDLLEHGIPHNVSQK